MSLREDWLAALRSGEYKQGIAFLRSSDDHFCCLGVLADVAGVEWHYDSYTYYYNADHNRDAFPDDELLEKVGLTVDQAWELTALNDNGKPFSEIADVIEQL